MVAISLSAQRCFCGRWDWGTIAGFTPGYSACFLHALKHGASNPSGIPSGSATIGNNRSIFAIGDAHALLACR
jgi:hypothetical protein